MPHANYGFTIQQVFPDLDTSRQSDLSEQAPSGVPLIVATATGIELTADRTNLRLLIRYDLGCWEASRNMSYDEALQALRVCQAKTATLELVVVPLAFRRASALERAERIAFLQREWEFIGWQHNSRRKAHRRHERWQREFGPQEIDSHLSLEVYFRLKPKLSATKYRVLGVYGTFQPSVA